MTLHASLEPVRNLIGTWRGTGHGEYPTINSFDYTEELTFTDIGKPFLVYEQKTWSAGGDLMHVETGYFRLPGNDTLEFVIAIPTGQTELGQGPFTIEPSGFSTEVQGELLNSTTSKVVNSTIRRLKMDGNTLETSFDMAAVGVEMVRHLTATLEKQV